MNRPQSRKPKLLILIPLLVELLTLNSLVYAHTVEGPEVFWRVSVWGSPRAFSAGMEALAARMSIETEGRFRIKIYYDSELSEAQDNLDGIKANKFESAAICDYHNPEKRLALTVFSLPFLPLDVADVNRHVRSKMMEHPAVVADMEQWNAIPFVSGLLPQYEFLGRGEPPTSLQDWKGKQVRAVGGIADAMEILGAVSYELSPGESSIALQNGDIDAVGLPFTYAHVAFKVANEAEWFTTNLSPGSSECGWVLNKTAFDNLPSQYQSLLLENRNLVMDIQQAAYKGQDTKNLPVFEKNMLKINYSSEMLAGFRDIAGKSVWDAWINGNSGKFDSQSVFDAVWRYAEEVKK